MQHLTSLLVVRCSSERRLVVWWIGGMGREGGREGDWGDDSLPQGEEGFPVDIQSVGDRGLISVDGGRRRTGCSRNRPSASDPRAATPVPFGSGICGHDSPAFPSRDPTRATSPSHRRSPTSGNSRSRRRNRSHSHHCPDHQHLRVRRRFPCPLGVHPWGW